MFVLMVISIILKLLSAHFLLEYYRKKKIEPVIAFLSLLFIGGLIIMDFTAINFFLSKFVGKAQFFMVSMTLFTSILSVILTRRIGQTKKSLENSYSNEESLTFNNFLKSIAVSPNQNPMVVINKNKKNLYMTEGFEELLKEKSDVELHCKVSSHECDVSQLLVLFFEECPEASDSKAFKEDYKEKIKKYEGLLEVGQWTYHFSDNMIYYSDQVQNMFALKSNKLPYNEFKKLVHPQDLMFINILDSKTLWVNGIHTRHIRIRWDEGIKYATIHYHPINDEQGLPIGAKGIIQDISEQRNYLTSQFIKEKNDYMSRLVIDYETELSPLLLTLKENQRLGYIHKEVDRLLRLMEGKKKIYNHRKHDNLISANKFIEETVKRFASVWDQFDIKLNLNSQHSLLAIDEMSFKQMLSYLLTEFTDFQYRLPLYIETQSQGNYFNLKYELGIHPMLGEFMHKFKRKLLSPPKGVEDSSLFHAYTIIKCFKGSIQFYTENNHYGLEISFPAINMSIHSEKETLKELLYYGDNLTFKERIGDFLKGFHINLVKYEEAEKLDAYQVIIFDGSVSIGEQFLLSKKYPKGHFISFAPTDKINVNNMVFMQEPISMSELTKILGGWYNLNQ